MTRRAATNLEKSAAHISTAMGFGNRTMGLAKGVNPNLKGDASVKMFATSAGLDVQGFPEYLSGIVANGNPLGTLSNEAWTQILAPMELGGERAARATRAIIEVRQAHERDQAMQDEKSLHVHLVNGGAHPHARPGAEVYEPTLNGARPRPVNDGSFIPVAFFQGEKEGWTFKHGDEGLGYYLEGASATGAGPAAPMVTNVSRGFTPTSQAGVEDKQASQQRAYTQSRHQQLLSERRARMDEQRQGTMHSTMHSKGQMSSMYSDARTRSSPFATGY